MVFYGSVAVLAAAWAMKRFRFRIGVVRNLRTLFGRAVVLQLVGIGIRFTVTDLASPVCTQSTRSPGRIKHWEDTGGAGIRPWHDFDLITVVSADLKLFSTFR